MQRSTTAMLAAYTNLYRTDRPGAVHVFVLLMQFPEFDGMWSAMLCSPENPRPFPIFLGTHHERIARQCADELVMLLPSFGLHVMPFPLEDLYQRTA